MLMVGLAYELEKINGLRFAIGADDVSFWTKEAWIGDQMSILQTALNVTQTEMRSVGMATSIEKTAYVLVHRDENIRAKAAHIFILFVDGQTIVTQSTI